MALSLTARRGSMLVPIVDLLTSVPDVVPGPGYAHAVTASGKLAFVPGQVALDADGRLVGPGDLAAQLAQALRNLHCIPGALGADWPVWSASPGTSLTRARSR
jgi:enamine deaminase RidA (YjgF/YER057c/UK114 family)